MTADVRYGREWVVRLPWDKPPLSMNDRSHWRVKANATSAAKVQTMLALADAFGDMYPPPFLGACDVTLTYVPRDKRRRDTDNIVATLKVVCDAAVTAGLVLDDEPRYMTKHMPVILPPDGDPRLELRIREVLPP